MAGYTSRAVAVRIMGCSHRTIPAHVFEVRRHRRCPHALPGSRPGRPGRVPSLNYAPVGGDMNTRLGHVKATLSAFVLIGTACAPVAPAPAAAPTNAATGAGPTLVVAPAATTADQPKPGGRLIVGDGSDSKTLQPVISTDTSSSLVWARMYETLIDVDPMTGSPVPRLAEKFEVSPDSKTMTFTLRDGLQWSDGSAFSGDDFAF